MISNKNIVNYKVVQLFEINNFGFGHFSMIVWKKSNFKCEKFKHNFVGWMILNKKVVSTIKLHNFWSFLYLYDYI